MLEWILNSKMTFCYVTVPREDWGKPVSSLASGWMDTASEVTTVMFLNLKDLLYKYLILVSKFIEKICLRLKKIYFQELHEKWESHQHGTKQLS